MGNSLRSNAERLLGDVQRVHSRLLSQIARVEREAGISPAPARGTRRDRAAAPGGDGGRAAGVADDDGLEVPEFIPPG
jgi:hypothetical protein